MTRPDFAYADISKLTDGDVRFLVERFPEPGRSYAEFAKAIDSLPTTLESMLTSQTVVEQVIHERQTLLKISPFLLFNVLLRQVLPPPRDGRDRRVIHYLANLLALFVRSHRVTRVQEGDEEGTAYLVDLLEKASGADPRRRFLVHAHVGNYSLYLTGVFGAWLEQRHRHGRRPVSPDYYADLGSSSFAQASALPPAGEYDLIEVFLRLSWMFDAYRRGLAELADHYLLRN